MNILYKGNKGITKESLDEALEACNRANAEGYSDSKVYLQALKKSVREASEIIVDCINSMRRHHINDEELVNRIREQLLVVQNKFEQTYQETKASLDEKKKSSSKFNITLFGRTKAGKSTLMEILTHGDGSHMGKGGQRTTRDVRSYDWKGMSVIDVPGIDAWDGAEDDKLAEEAAIYADLILFLITAGQPEGTEADWLVKLKRMDKPVVCICNYKQSIDDERRLERFLSNPQLLAERMNVAGLVMQFNEFIHEHLPNEHVDFIVTHLYSKFASQQSKYADKKEALERVSLFDSVEKALINEVHKNGVLYRKKCYLSIIDVPIYQQMGQLFTFSNSSYSQYRLIQDKVNSFEKWCKKFNDDERSVLENVINQEYNKLRDSVPGFVETHLEDDDVNAAWTKHCSLFSIGYNIKKADKNTQQKLKKRVSELFSDLDKETKFSISFDSGSKLGNYQITNWKRGVQWAGILGSTGMGIAAIILGSTPLGWAALSVTAVSTFIAWLFDSREEKLTKKRQELSQKLNEKIDKSERKTQREIRKHFDNTIIPNEETTISRLKMLSRSMLSLANGERQLALGFNQNHKDITKMIITNILLSLGVSIREVDRIKTVARVPGRRVAIILDGEENIPCQLTDIVSKLGNKETINIIKLRPYRSKEEGVCFLLRYFGIHVKPLVLTVNDGQQTIVYLYNKNYSLEQLDSIELVQQIMNVHIILKEKEL